MLSNNKTNGSARAVTGKTVRVLPPATETIQQQQQQHYSPKSGKSSSATANSFLATSSSSSHEEDGGALVRNNNKALVRSTTGDAPQLIENGQPCDKCAENCSGYRASRSKIWNKRCESCNCPPYNHRLMCAKPSVQDQIQLQLPSWLRNLQSAVKSNFQAADYYVWAPYGLSRDKIAEYMKDLPEYEKPVRGTAGEFYWHKQLIYQFPGQDFFAQCNKHLKSDSDVHAFEEFTGTRNDVALDRGYIIPNLAETAQCRGCKGILHKNSLCVAAPKVSENAFYHPHCLVCYACKQLLPEMVYCARNESYVTGDTNTVQHVTRIYCARHFGEKLKPRCSACDELIFSTEYTRAMNANWHVEHFACNMCSTLLTGERYVLSEDLPICLKCYEKTYANTCCECKRPIGVDSAGGRDLAYKDRHWHEHCFLCCVCKMSLVDKPFGTKNEKIYCGNCYDQSFGERCCKCSDVFKAGTKKLEYKDRHWHLRGLNIP